MPDTSTFDDASASQDAMPPSEDGTTTEVPQISKPIALNRAWQLPVNILGVILVISTAIELPQFVLIGIAKTIIFKIASLTGLVAVVTTLASYTIKPLEDFVARTVYKNPSEPTPGKMLVAIIFFVYPVLLLNLLSPFKADMWTFLRVLLFQFMFHTYGVTWAYPGMTHHEAHASWVKGGIVKDEYKRFFDRVGEWWVYPLFGIAPGTATYQHVLIHHKYCNNLDDPQSCLWYNRASAWDFFMLYHPYNLVNRSWGFGGAAKLEASGQTRFAQKLREGQLRFALVIGTCFLLNPKFFLFVQWPAMCVFVIGINANEWIQHAFLNPEDDKCTPGLATTTIDLQAGRYREEPWHIIHHALNTPNYYAGDKASEKSQLWSYIEGRSNKKTPMYVFGNGYGWIDLFVLLTVLSNFEKLADALVWTGEGERPSKAELIAFLKKSVTPVRLEQYTPEALLKQELVGPASVEQKTMMKVRTN